MSSYLLSDENLGFDVIPDIFTTPWQLVLAKKIFKDTGDPKLKSLWGASGYNTDLMDLLVKLASDKLAPGANRWTYMNANANVNDKICQSFFRHIKDPDVIDSPSFIGSVMDSIRAFFKGTSKIPETLPLILVILAGGAAAYLVFMGKGGKKIVL